MAVPIELDIDAILAANDRDIHKSPAMIDLPQHTANGDIKMVSTTLPASPLEGFVRIKDKVHLHTPAEPLPAGSRDPGFIIICSWAFAKPRYIVKYIKGYQSVYPNSKILLVQMAVNDMLFRPDSWQMPLIFNAAAQQVKQYVDSVGSANTRILLQTYSNGGSHSAVQLAESYNNQYGVDMPISALVMDSTPGTPRYWETIAAMQTDLPKGLLARTVGTALIHSTIFTCGILHWTGIAELANQKLYRTLNDTKEAFLKAHIPRTYIHSKEDVMILSRDVEAHAADARAKLLEKGAMGDMVVVEEFHGTQHVMHMPSDPERYWKIVRDTWEKAQP